jgi:sulfide:quinone oxidoreductase
MVTLMRHTTRSRVLIAGGGVAALETLLALRAVAGERVDITLISPETKFFNRSMAVDQPSRIRSGNGLKLRDVAGELGARWHRATVGHVDSRRRVVVTEKGHELAYDRLVLAVGARAGREWHVGRMLTYHGAVDVHDYRRLMRQLEAGSVGGVAVVHPQGAPRLVPRGEVALATAAACETLAVPPELSLITPEAEPLEVFGTAASAGVRAALEESGVRLFTSTHAVPSRPGRLHLSPGDRRITVDCVVTIPRLVGPELPGVPPGPDGFIRTDAHGRALGMEHVFAAGDATSFPIKQGGLAAQQADAVAESLAASVGVDIVPRPFRPVLRGLIVAHGGPQYMRARIAAGAGEDCALSEAPLWWPPNRLGGRYLAPYLTHRAGGGATMFRDDASAFAAGGGALERGTGRLAELADL